MDSMSFLGPSLQLFGSAINAYNVSRTKSEDRAFMERMYEKQKAYSDYTWERNNTYNSPKAQVQRLLDGGLNPNLVFGHGTPVNTAAIANQPSYVSHHSQSPYVDLGSLNFAQMLAELELVQSQAEKNKAEAKQSLSNAAATDWQTSFNQSTESLRTAMMSNDNYKVLREISKIDSEIFNSTALANKSLELSDEQLKTMIQGRFYQIAEYDLKAYEVGSAIKVAIRNADTAAKNADTNAMNAVTSRIMAISNADRNAILNELTSAQVGDLVFRSNEYKRYRAGYSSFTEGQYDMLKRDATDFKDKVRYRELGGYLGRFEQYVDVVTSILPFAKLIK